MCRKRSSSAEHECIASVLDAGNAPSAKHNAGGASSCHPSGVGFRVCTGNTDRLERAAKNLKGVWREMDAVWG